MEHLLDIYLLGFLQNFIDWIIDYGGLYILLLVVFAETGLFVGFFFPGDSLLFAAGVFLDKISNKFIGVAQDAPTQFGWPHITIIVMIMVASILGNIVGYWFGRKTGPLLYERKETLLFRKKHLVRAKAFYDKYGNWQYTMLSYPPSVLAKPVKELILENFPGYQISFATEIRTSDQEPAYVINIENEDHIKVVHVSGDNFEVRQAFNKK